MNIGIVGAENSHTIAIATTLNIESAVPDCKVSHVWGETEELAAMAAEKGAIPTIVSDPTEMISHVDAVVVDHRHGKYHLPAARPFVEAGLPVFVDKPFCVDLQEGIEFVRLARKKKVSITSYSVLPLQQSFLRFKDLIRGFDVLRSIATAGPVELDSEYGGIFFYGIHQIDALLNLIQGRPLSVKASRLNDDGVAVITFDTQVLGLVNCFHNWNGDFIATAYSSEKVAHATLNFDENIYLAGIRRFCEMFQTHKEPLPAASYLTPVAVLAALQEAFKTGAEVAVQQVPQI